MKSVLVAHAGVFEGNNRSGELVALIPRSTLPVTKNARRREQHLPLSKVGKNTEKIPVLRRVLVSLGFVICVGTADLTSARQVDLRVDTVSALRMCDESISPSKNCEIAEHVEDLARHVPIQQIFGERHPRSQARLLAAASGEWSALLKKTGFDRLRRSVKRSLANFDYTGAGRPLAEMRDKSKPVRQDPADSSAATTAWQASQIGVERIAIPQPRPSRDSVGEEERPKPILSVPAQPPIVIFGKGHLVLGIAATSLTLIAAIVLLRNRNNARRSRDRARAEKAIYDAIAELPKNGNDFRTDVSGVLRQIEDAYGLGTISLVMFQPVTLDVQTIYSSEAQAPWPKELFKEAISEIRTQDEDMSDLTLWRYPGSAHWARGKQRPDAVISVVWLGNRVAAMLIARCPPGRRSRSTDTQTLQLVTQLLAIVIEAHSRLAAMPSSSAEASTAVTNGEELAGSIAHEFNNLLMAIMGYAEMAANALNPGSSPRAYVQRIQSAGERARQVIDQTLTFSKRQGDWYGSFDVIAAAAEILPDLKVCAPALTHFRTNLPHGPVRIQGSATALQQALINLCKNAGEAMSGGGTITLSVRLTSESGPRILTHGRLVSGRYVRVSVADTGPGIPATDLRRIFDPFFTTRTSEGGTGLGLAMVLRTVRLLRGGLNVRSAPGFGTRFDLFFPCLSEAEESEQDWATVAAE